MLTVTVAGGPPRPLDAYYSFYVNVLPDESVGGTFLLVTAVDPAFDCAQPTGGLDALAFIFQAARGVGATTTTILSARGPDFDTVTGGSGMVTLTADDDRLSGYDLDGGTVSAGSGGSVAGTLHFAAGSVTVDGSFTAARCAALDFIVPG